MNDTQPTPAPLSAWIESPEFDWSALTAPDSAVQKLRKGQTLFSQGEPVREVYVVEEGRVRLALLSAAGFEQHMAIVGPCGLVGECGAFLDGRHSVTAIASTDARVRPIVLPRLRQRLLQSPRCLQQLLWLGNVKLRVLAHQNLLLSQATATQRVAHHLLQLASTYGQPCAQGTSLGIAFTHQEMANISGLSRVMVSNVLSQLDARGLIGKADNGHWVILDMTGLRQHSISL